LQYKIWKLSANKLIIYSYILSRSVATRLLYIYFFFSFQYSGLNDELLAPNTTAKSLLKNKIHTIINTRNYDNGPGGRWLLSITGLYARYEVISSAVLTVFTHTRTHTHKEIVTTKIVWWYTMRSWKHWKLPVICIGRVTRILYICTHSDTYLHYTHKHNITFLTNCFVC